MPNKIYLPNPTEDNGIVIVWKKKEHILSFSGWFDSFVEIEGGAISLEEFFKEIGITKKDCDKAFEK